MLGQLSDAGNTVTIAHYFHLLSAAYLMAPLQRWSGSRIRQRGSIPKIVLRDNSLVTALTPAIIKNGRLDPAWKGRLVENAVGAALLAMAEREGSEVFYWRDRQDEVDYILKRGQQLVAIEVKSGKETELPEGLRAFRHRNKQARSVMITREAGVGEVEWIGLEDFLIKGEI